MTARSIRQTILRYLLMGVAIPIGFAIALLLNLMAVLAQTPAPALPGLPAAPGASVSTAATEATQPMALARPQASSPLGLAKSWGYQLQAPDPDRLAKAPHDVLVIDYSRNGQSDEAFAAADIARMKTRTDGPPRVVLAYLSIGEAEEYRYYWKRYYGWLWGIFAPSWRGRHNAEWSGNYGVRYWEQSWADIIFDKPGSYLERIIAAGFDGIYLDKIDEFEEMGRGRPTAKADMIAFVTRLAEKARALKPGFLIVPQNGDELLVDDGYRKVVDAIAKESLLYGEENEGVENAEALTLRRIERLKKLTAEGKPVFVVEYLDRAAQISSAREMLESLGFVPHFANKALDRMRFGDLPEAGEGVEKP